ncbi:MAG: hypothetical protein Q8Q35_00170 [Nanoarchaeota archaeon]|nr:hypothetical protein [Nanoarchaeota archaeon]
MEKDKIRVAYVGENFRLYGGLCSSISPDKYEIDRVKGLVEDSRRPIDGLIVDAGSVSPEFMRIYHRLNANRLTTHGRIPLMVVSPSDSVDHARRFMEEENVDYYASLKDVDATVQDLSHRIRELTFRKNNTSVYRASYCLKCR